MLLTQKASRYTSNLSKETTPREPTTALKIKREPISGMRVQIIDRSMLPLSMNRLRKDAMMVRSLMALMIRITLKLTYINKINKSNKEWGLNKCNKEQSMNNKSNSSSSNRSSKQPLSRTWNLGSSYVIVRRPSLWEVLKRWDPAPLRLLAPLSAMPFSPIICSLQATNTAMTFHIALKTQHQSQKERYQLDKAKIIP